MIQSTPSTTLVAERRTQPRNATRLIGDLSYGVVYAGQGWAGLALMVNVMKLVAGPQDFATILRMTHVTDVDAFVHSSMALALGVGLVLGVLRPFIGEAWAMVLVGWVITVPLAIGGAWVNGGLSVASPAWAWILVLAAAAVLGGGMGFAFWKGNVIEVRQAAVAQVIDQTELPVSAETVLRALREALFPLLRAKGFTVFGERGAWRYRQDRIDAVLFQVGDESPGRAAAVRRFRVVLGQYLTCVPEDGYPVDRLDGQLAPNVDQCHVTCSLRDYHRVVDGRVVGIIRDWSLAGPQGTSLKGAVAHASELLSLKFFWFDDYANDRRVLELFWEGPQIFHWDGTTVADGPHGILAQRVRGYLHLKLGNRREALQHLKDLLQYEYSRRRADELVSATERLARDVAFLELDI